MWDDNDSDPVEGIENMAEELMNQTFRDQYDIRVCSNCGEEAIYHFLTPKGTMTCENCYMKTGMEEYGYTEDDFK